jgi:hypothetical protein
MSELNWTSFLIFNMAHGIAMDMVGGTGMGRIHWNKGISAQKER